MYLSNVDNKNETVKTLCAFYSVLNYNDELFSIFAELSHTIRKFSY